MKPINELITKKVDKRGRPVLGSPIPCAYCGAVAEDYDAVYHETYRNACQLDAKATSEELHNHAVEIADQVLKQYEDIGAVHFGLERRAAWYHIPIRCCEKAKKTHSQKMAQAVKGLVAPVDTNRPKQNTNQRKTELWKQAREVNDA